MSETFAVRTAGPAAIIDITGDLTVASEDTLMDAYARASTDGLRAVVLNFEGLQYMNSSGIGLLVTLLVRAHRQGRQVLAYGLSEHYRQIFELTRLDEAVGIHDTVTAGREAGPHALLPFAPAPTRLSDRGHRALRPLRRP